MDLDDIEDKRGKISEIITFGAANEVAKKEMEKMDDKWVVNVYNELAEDQGNLCFGGERCWYDELDYYSIMKYFSELDNFEVLDGTAQTTTHQDMLSNFRVALRRKYKLEDTFAHNQPPGPRVIDEVVKSNETSVNVAQEGVDSSIKSRNPGFFHRFRRINQENLKKEKDEVPEAKSPEKKVEEVEELAVGIQEEYPDISQKVSGGYAKRKPTRRKSNRRKSFKRRKSTKLRKSNKIRKSLKRKSNRRKSTRKKLSRRRRI